MTAIRERALELLERHIANGREDGADPAVTARECMLALEGIGYRPTEARPAADWKLHAAGSGPSEATRALMDAAKERAAEAAARIREQDGAA
ncbi:MAG TPA: hypothetical protein VGS06_01510 [Streptosporangiaceae bacterium]|nr:hypothetical protein [Streptosporangiaceae bacterium]